MPNLTYAKLDYKLHFADKGKVQCFECGRMLLSVDHYKLHMQMYHEQWKIHINKCRYCHICHADTINAVTHQLEHFLVGSDQQILQRWKNK